MSVRLLDVEPPEALERLGLQAEAEGQART
jgi:hypothetical protein